MGYLDEYNARSGKCEYCKHRSVTGSNRCVECYGYAFEDKLGVYEFIRKRVSEDAAIKYDESSDGKLLLEKIDECKKALLEAEDFYKKEREKCIDKELKRIEDTINAL